MLTNQANEQMNETLVRFTSTRTNVLNQITNLTKKGATKGTETILCLLDNLKKALSLDDGMAQGSNHVQIEELVNLIRDRSNNETVIGNQYQKNCCLLFVECMESLKFVGSVPDKLHVIRTVIEHYQANESTKARFERAHGMLDDLKVNQLESVIREEDLMALDEPSFIAPCPSYMQELQNTTPRTARANVLDVLI